MKYKMGGKPVIDLAEIISQTEAMRLDRPVIANRGFQCQHCKAEYAKEFTGKPGPDPKQKWEFNADTRDNISKATSKL